MFTLSFAALLGSVIFSVAFMFAHYSAVNLRFTKDALSKYAHEDRGWVISTGLYAIGGAQILLSISLALDTNFSLGHTLLMVAGSGAIIVATFKMEWPVKTIYGLVHRFGAALQFAAFPSALFLLSSQLTGSAFYVWTVLVGLVSSILLLSLVIFAINGTAHSSSYFGLIQKTDIIFMTAWVGTLSLAGIM